MDPISIYRAFEDYKDMERKYLNILAQSEIEQIKHETELIYDRDESCPYEMLKGRTTTKEDVDRAMKEGFGDANVLDTLLCVNNGNLLLPQTAGLASNYLVRTYIQNLYVKGAPSSAGLAMDAQLFGQSNSEDAQFVVKAPRPNDITDDITHEYFVGAFGTNRLRSKIPNFSYVMGMFRCSPPFYDAQSGTNRVSTFCQNTDPKNLVNYIIYENVKDSETFANFLRHCSFVEYLNIITQLVLALEIAYQELDFTHYDLHTTNVMIKKMPKKIVLPYTIGDKTYYVVTQYIATIIDYGRCHIKYMEEDYGFFGLKMGIRADTSYPMYDVFKIVLFSLFDAASENLLKVYNNRHELYDKLDEEIFPNLGTRFSTVYTEGRKLLKYFYDGF